MTRRVTVNLKLIRQGDGQVHVRGTGPGRALCDEVLNAPRLAKTEDVRIEDICEGCLIKHMRRKI